MTLDPKALEAGIEALEPFMDNTTEDGQRRMAVAAISAYLAALPPTAGAELPGYKLVPVEPTEAMLHAWPRHNHGAGHERAIYAAMLAASPPVPVQPVKAGEPDPIVIYINQDGDPLLTKDDGELLTEMLREIPQPPFGQKLLPLYARPYAPALASPPPEPGEREKAIEECAVWHESEVQRYNKMARDYGDAGLKSAAEICLAAAIEHRNSAAALRALREGGK